VRESEEFSIQSILPFALGGTAVGAVGGFVVGKLVSPLIDRKKNGSDKPILRHLQVIPRPQPQEQLVEAAPRGTFMGFGVDWQDAWQLVVIYLLAELTLGYLIEARLLGPAVLAFKPLIQEGLLGIALALILVKLQPQSWRMLEWRMLQPAQLLALILLTLPLGGWLRSLANEGAWSGYPFLGVEYAARYVSYAGLIAGCLVIPVVEEVFFRGFLGRTLMARHGAVLGALIAAVLYAATRLNYQLLVPCVFMSLALQGVYLATRSILAPILLHGSSNLLAFALDLYQGSKLALGVTSLLAILAIGLFLFQPFLQYRFRGQLRARATDGGTQTPQNGAAGAVPYSIIYALPAAYLPFFVLLLHYHRFS
jgi:membrane protease YdiL (CAAX protease family)